MSEFPSIPYPPIEKLGLIGDRRTAGLVAADGTLCWMTLPNYDSAPAFGAVLDAAKGGLWKLGPRARHFGSQSYASDTPVLQTTWSNDQFSLDLLDFMIAPANNRNAGDAERRTVVRWLRCTRGRASCRIYLQPRDDFAHPMSATAVSAQQIVFDESHGLGFWSSKPMHPAGGVLDNEIELGAGEQIWCVFGPGEHLQQWSADSAAQALRDTIEYWRRWLGKIDFQGARRKGILRSAMVVHLLTFAPTGALVASPTTSLPERIGGSRNYDYRLTWIRDASLGLGLLAKLGLTEDAERFMQWIANLQAADEGSLQILYRIDGSSKASAIRRDDIEGYRQSKPVQFGNAAESMIEIDSYGYLTDCALTYLDSGGKWEPQYWSTICRVADYTAENWRRPGSSIWELRPQQQFVTSKVMSAVTLDRALSIARRTGQNGDFLARWEAVRVEIIAEVMERGWSDRLGAFRQRYDSETVDAAALLIPIMGLLPVDHPRVTTTIAKLVEHLDLNGFLHRFVSSEFSGDGSRPIGEEEGGFLMCSFWLAQVLAQRGDVERADAILRRAEAVAGELCLFAEGMDARNATFLGNMPLVFSQVEYARAAIAIGEQRAQRS